VGNQPVARGLSLTWKSIVQRPVGMADLTAVGLPRLLSKASREQDDETDWPESCAVDPVMKTAICLIGVCGFVTFGVAHASPETLTPKQHELITHLNGNERKSMAQINADREARESAKRWKTIVRPRLISLAQNRALLQALSSVREHLRAKGIKIQPGASSDGQIVLGLAVERDGYRTLVLNPGGLEERHYTQGNGAPPKKIVRIVPAGSAGEDGPVTMDAAFTERWQRRLLDEKDLSNQVDIGLEHLINIKSQ